MKTTSRFRQERSEITARERWNPILGPGSERRAEVHQEAAEAPRIAPEPEPSRSPLVAARAISEPLSPTAALLLEGARTAAGLSWDGNLLPGMHAQRDAVSLAEAYARIPGAPELTDDRRRTIRSAMREIAAAGFAKLARIGRDLALTVNAERLADRRRNPQRIAFAKLAPDLAARTGKGWAVELLVHGADEYRAGQGLRRWSNRDLAERLGLSKRAVVKARTLWVPCTEHCGFRSPPEPEHCGDRSPLVGSEKAQAHVTTSDEEPTQRTEVGRQEGSELRSDAPRTTETQSPTPPAILDRLGPLERDAQKNPGAEAARDRLRAMAPELDAAEREHGAADAWFLALTAAGVHAQAWFRTKRRTLAQDAAAQLGPPLGCLGALRLLRGRYADEIRNVGALLAEALTERPESLHAEAKAHGFGFLDEAAGVTLEPTEAEAATIAETRAACSFLAAKAAPDHRTARERIDTAMRELHRSPVAGLDLLAELPELNRIAEAHGLERALRRAIDATMRKASEALEHRTAERAEVAARIRSIGAQALTQHLTTEAAARMFALAA